MYGIQTIILVRIYRLILSRYADHLIILLLHTITYIKEYIHDTCVLLLRLIDDRQRYIARISGVRRCSLQVYNIIIIKMYLLACNQIPITHIYIYTCIIYDVDVCIIFSLTYCVHIYNMYTCGNLFISKHSHRYTTTRLHIHYSNDNMHRALAMKFWTTLYIIIIKIYENVRSFRNPV